MDWEKLNKTVYYEDGSLRDVYIYDTTINDWKKWIEYTNKNFSVTFLNMSNEATSDKIDFNEVVKYWRGENEDGVSASININGVNLKCYFNMENEIEMDFSPKEIRNIIDHNNLVEYLKACSTILEKPVVATAEMAEDEILFTIDNGDIFLP